jgi:hypothetical protein
LTCVKIGGQWRGRGGERERERWSWSGGRRRRRRRRRMICDNKKEENDGDAHVVENQLIMVNLVKNSWWRWRWSVWCFYRWLNNFWWTRRSWYRTGGVWQWGKYRWLWRRPRAIWWWAGPGGNSSIHHLDDDNLKNRRKNKAWNTMTKGTPYHWGWL